MESWHWQQVTTFLQGKSALLRCFKPADTTHVSIGRIWRKKNPKFQTETDVTMPVHRLPRVGLVSEAERLCWKAKGLRSSASFRIPDRGGDGLSVLEI